MSGTSYDGIDVAVADIGLDGDVVTLAPRGWASVPYAPGLREQIASALPPATITMDAVCRLDTGIGQAFAQAAHLDTGPGNALLDAAALHFTGRPYDEDGRLAAGGTVIPALLERLLADPYYAREPPKTTGKEHFNRAYLGDSLDHEPRDVLATLTRLTARTVADAARRHRATELIASGGGVRNPTLMTALAQEAALAITTSDALGLPAQAKEAYAFALLGFLTYHGLPGTLPSATGARHASLLGSITPGAGTRAAPKALRLA